MELGQRKQAFSFAFARAVAAVAGFKITGQEVDDDSIDLGFAAGAQLPKRPRLEVQMKCSADVDLRDEDFSFALSLKNYDDLRAETLVPRILVVVRVPPDPIDWLRLDEQELAMRHCAYWHSLAGAPEEPNTTSVTVRVSRGRVFDPKALTQIMARIEAGETP